MCFALLCFALLCNAMQCRALLLECENIPEKRLLQIADPWCFEMRCYALQCAALHCAAIDVQKTSGGDLFRTLPDVLCGALRYYALPFTALHLANTRPPAHIMRWKSLIHFGFGSQIKTPSEFQ